MAIRVKNEDLIVIIDKLRAFFANEYMNWKIDKVIGNNGCDTCGYGATEGITLGGVNQVLDLFLEQQTKEEL